MELIIEKIEIEHVILQESDIHRLLNGKELMITPKLTVIMRE